MGITLWFYISLQSLWKMIKMEQEEYRQNLAYGNKVSQEEMIKVIERAIKLKETRDKQSKLEKTVGNIQIEKETGINEKSRVIDKEALYKIADDLNLSREEVDKALYEFKASKVSNARVLAKTLGIGARCVGELTAGLLFLPTTFRRIGNYINWNGGAPFLYAFLLGVGGYFNTIMVMGTYPGGIGEFNYRKAFFVAGALALTNIASGVYEGFRYLKKKEIEKIK